MPNGLTRVLLVIATVAATGLIWFKGYDMFTGRDDSVIEGIDDTCYFLWLRSAVIDHDLDFANDFEQTPTISTIHRDDILNWEPTETGRIPNKYWIGWALLNSIPYGTVYLAAVWRGLEVTGFEPSFQVAIWAFQFLLGVVSLRFAYLLIRRYTKSEAALLGVLLVWLASPLLYYQTARISLVHNQVFFLITALYLLTFRIKDGQAGIWTWILMGLISGLAFVTRSTAVVYLLFPMVVVVGVIRDSDWKQWLPRSILALAGALVPVILQMGAWKSVYGHTIVFSYQGESFVNLASPKILAVLFSDFHGLFNWHPFLLVGFAAFTVSALRVRDIRIVWLISSLLIIYLNASWWCYWFGSSFGNRAFEVLNLFAMLGTALLLDRPRPSWIRRGVLVLGLFGMVWNAQLLVGYLIQSYPRDLPVSISERILDSSRQPSSDQDP